jgi:ADP-ribose pyrophosphatase YjhB (NUDIX family)
VVNGDSELLVVHEKGRSSRGRHYKLPGGALQAGEHLVDGVVREVLEETGIETRFISLACFRNQHGYRHGRSDIYFVCRLEPLTHEITLQEEEIEECLWMPIDDYYRAQEVSFFNKLIVRAALESPGVVPTFVEGYRDPETVEVFLPRGTSQVF